MKDDEFTLNSMLKGAKEQADATGPCPEGYCVKCWDEFYQVKLVDGKCWFHDKTKVPVKEKTKVMHICTFCGEVYEKIWIHSANGVKRCENCLCNVTSIDDRLSAIENKLGIK